MLPTVILLEAVALWVFHLLLPAEVSPWVQSLMEVLVITGILVPALWWFLFQPVKHSLEREAAKSRVIMETAAEGIFTTDEHGVILSLNRAAETIFGYAAREVVGQPVSLLLPVSEPEQPGKHIIDDTGVQRVSSTWYEVQGRRRDGTLFPIEVALSEVLVGSERIYTSIVRDISERKEAEQRIWQLAHFDTLTGLPNRMLFYDRLRQTLRRAKRERQGVALLFLDLDGFKQVNDNLGHAVGDALLQVVAARLKDCVRDSDTVARLAGDEFTVILPDCHEREHAVLVAEKIAEALREPIEADGLLLTTSASIGIAMYPQDAETEDGLVRMADAAMYAVKPWSATVDRASA